MMKKFTFILLCLVIGISTVVAQNTKVAGSVISADDGLPVIGASIVVKGTMVGTVTDYDGNFTLEVPSNGKVLIVSYVGMLTQEVPVSPNVRVVLKSDTQNLDEVVVTAMGISKEKKALGYAVQDVKGEKLTQAANSNLAGALQGKVSGLDIKPSSGMPGASSQITIRGARSFSGDNTPLYVIDGMPVNTTADFDTGKSVTGANYADRSIDINPEDIESVNILKGQAASALYGIRASNGVIVITTKRGSKNNMNKPSVTISTNLSAQRVSRKFERQNIYSQGNSIAAGYDPSSSMTWGPKISELANDPKYGGNMNNQYTAADGMREGQYYNPKRAQAGLDGWTTPQIYDNVGDFLGTGFTENTNVNLSQSINGINYSFGVNNSHQNGIIPSTGMDRWGARGLVDWKINPQWNTILHELFIY